MTIQATKILHDVHLGDSIAINGICLTVTNFTNNSFSVDVMPETVKATTAKSLRVGDYVNLERAMAANGRFGGHFVSGHVDGVGKIIRRQTRDNALLIDIQVPGHLTDWMIMKGSVCVDGTSLTIFGLTADSFTISLIPHTQDEVITAKKKVGEEVNIECDMMAKYIQQMLEKKQRSTPEKSGITMDFLQNNGY